MIVLNLFFLSNNLKSNNNEKPKYTRFVYKTYQLLFATLTISFNLFTRIIVYNIFAYGLVG